jgi:hypothetical protein
MKDFDDKVDLCGICADKLKAILTDFLHPQRGSK